MASEIKVDTIVNAGGDNDTGIDLSTNDNIKFDIAGSQKAMIDSSGNLLVATTNSGIGQEGIQLLANGRIGASASGASGLLVNRDTSDGNIAVFQRANSTVGSIHNLQSGSAEFTLKSESGLTLESNDSSTQRRLFLSNGSLKPYNADDNTLDLGTGVGRWDDVFATNGTIQTSDQNEKQDIASATTKELNVAKKLSTLFKTFRWKDKVAEKGDKARTHTGIVAQEVQSAFKEEGLDASNYGLFTSDTWTDDDGKERTRLGVRYPELFSFIFSSIEARLTALESK
jgi:hypothetical protein